jgi:hypothetical protein
MRQDGRCRTPERKPSIAQVYPEFHRCHPVGLDLAKNTFQVQAVDAKGEIVVAPRFTRGGLVAL